MSVVVQFYVVAASLPRQMAAYSRLYIKLYHYRGVVSLRNAAKERHSMARSPTPWHEAGVARLAALMIARADIVALSFSSSRADRETLSVAMGIFPFPVAAGLPRHLPPSPVASVNRLCFQQHSRI